MAIVTKYDNTTKICHGGVEYLSVWKNQVQYFPDPRTPPVPVPASEYIEVEIKATSSGEIRVPTNDVYNWNISIDGGSPVNYTRTTIGGNYLRITGYTADQIYNVVIRPGNYGYGWAKSFSYRTNTSSTHPAAQYLMDIVYDSSYVGYADSATDTGASFRVKQYYGCYNITTPAIEVIPNTVTTIGVSFRSGQYHGCTNLTTTAQEVMPNTVTSIGDNFRDSQYSGCYNLTTAANEVISSGISTIPNDFRAWQYYNCYDITTVGNEALPSSITSIGDNFRGMQYDGCSDLTSTAIEILPNTVVSIGTYFRRQQYRACASLSEIKGIKDLAIGNTNYRVFQFSGCNTNKTIKVLTDVGYNWAEPSYDSSLKNIYITQVEVPSAYLQNFIDTTNKPRGSITDSKFIGY